MNRAFSLYLDAMRFLSAMVVFISHFAYTRFTGGEYLIVRELNLGSDAVVFFFVLSGLVISYTAEVKDKAVKQYSWHRATRLFSVVIPALIVTVLLDTFGSRISPEAYNGWWYNDASVWLQLWKGLSFSSEWGQGGFRIGTNGPYWSLSYEAAYYMLFAAAFYLKGFWRVGLPLLLAAVFGVSILLLFPIWLMGLGVYKFIRSRALRPPAAWMCAAIPPLLYVFSLGIDLPGKLMALTIGALGESFVYGTLRFSDEFIWNNFIGALVAVHLIGVAGLCQYFVKMPKEIISKAIRWCAGATFTIYIIHYPAFQFVDTVLPETITPLARHGLLFGIVLGFCFAFAEISERRLKLFRTSLQSFFEKMKKDSAKPGILSKHS